MKNAFKYWVLNDEFESREDSSFHWAHQITCEIAADLLTPSDIFYQRPECSCVVLTYGYFSGTIHVYPAANQV